MKHCAFKCAGSPTQYNRTQIRSVTRQPYALCELQSPLDGKIPYHGISLDHAVNSDVGNKLATAADTEDIDISSGRFTYHEVGKGGAHKNSLPSILSLSPTSDNVAVVRQLQ